MTIDSGEHEIGTQLMYLKSLQIAHSVGHSQSDCPNIKIIAYIDFFFMLFGLFVKIGLVWFIRLKVAKYKMKILFLRYLKLSYLACLPCFITLMIM